MSNPFDSESDDIPNKKIKKNPFDDSSDDNKSGIKKNPFDDSSEDKKKDKKTTGKNGSNPAQKNGLAKSAAAKVPQKDKEMVGNPFDDSSEEIVIKSVKVDVDPFVSSESEEDFVLEIDREIERDVKSSAHLLDYLHDKTRAFNMDNLDHIDEDVFNKFLEEPMMVTALKKGVDLKEYHHEMGDQLHTLCKENELQYEEIEEDYGILYNDLCYTENVLDKIESIFDVYGERLELLKQQINNIQTQSLEAIVQLENRKAVEVNLGKYVNDINIPKNLIKYIANGKVSLTYIEYLREFISKSNYILQLPNNLLSVKLQKKKIIALTKKATQKIYVWLRKKVTAQLKEVKYLEKLQKPLSKYALLFQYLMDYGGELAVEIVDCYIDNIGHTYYTYFSSFTKVMGKRMLHIASKNDLLGESENKIKSFFTSTIEIKNRANVYSLSQREITLEYLATYVEFPSSNEKKTYEYLFRSLNHMFMNRVTEEMVFSKEFFTVDLSERIFGRTIALLEKNTKTFINESHDSIGLLILQCIIFTFKGIMQERNETCLHQYYNDLSTSIQERFQLLFAQQIESLQNAKPRNMGEIDIRSPHYVTRRYAEFIASILSIQRDYPLAVEPYNTLELLSIIRTDAMEGFLIKIADELNNEKDKLIFLINNYDLILSVSQERNIISPEIDAIDNLLRSYIVEYANVELNTTFSSFLTFTKECSHLDVAPNRDTNYVQNIMREFSEDSKWKIAVQDIYDNIMMKFPNFDNGTAVFDEVTNILITNYTIFTKIITQYFPALQNNKWFVSRKEVTYTMADFGHY